MKDIEFFRKESGWVKNKLFLWIILKKRIWTTEFLFLFQFSMEKYWISKNYNEFVFIERQLIKWVTELMK